MKKLIISSVLVGCIIVLLNFYPAFSRMNQQLAGYVLEHENEIAKRESGSHNGGGITTAYSFFAKEKDLKVVFRKRTLYPGSSIGYHLQEVNEIYYIVQGNGEMQMNGKTFPVSAGDAIFTRPGNSHGLKAGDKDSLVVLINYIVP